MNSKFPIKWRPCRLDGNAQGACHRPNLSATTTAKKNAERKLPEQMTGVCRRWRPNRPNRPSLADINNVFRELFH